MDIGGYTNVELLHTGRRSLIYRATPKDGGDSVVLKVLPGPYPSARLVDRLKREYAITSELAAPNVISANDIVDFRDSVAIVMEDIGGTSLASLQEQAQAQVALHRQVELVAKFLHQRWQPARIKEILHQVLAARRPDVGDHRGVAPDGVEVIERWVHACPPGHGDQMDDGIG